MNPRTRPNIVIEVDASSYVWTTGVAHKRGVVGRQKDELVEFGVRRWIGSAGYEYCSSRILTMKVVEGEDEVRVFRSCIVSDMSYTISYELIGLVRQSEDNSMSESSELPTEIEGNGFTTT